MRPATSAAQLPFEYGHTPSHEEADFVEGEGNRLAIAHIRSFPFWPGPLTLIEGPAKTGKSHLARIWADRTSAATFESGARHTVLPRSAPIVIEDIDRSDYPEDELFHLLNQSIRDHRPVLMTARSPIAIWPFETDDLKSRARLAQQFTLSLSDDIQLAQMFAKLFHDRQVRVDPGVVAYLVPRMERSLEEAVVLVELMDTIALSEGRPIGRRIAAAALARRGMAQLELDLEGGEE